MARLAFFADHLSHALKLKRQVLIRQHDLVESVGDFSRKPGLIAGQANSKVSVSHCLQRAKQFAHIHISLLSAFSAASISFARSRAAASGERCRHQSGSE
jgi:hypothetical protein